MTASRSSGSSGASSGLARDEVLEGGRVRAGAVEADQVAELRALVTDLRDRGLEARMVEEPGGLALVDDVGVLVGRRERGEADPDAAGARSADPGLEGAAAVGAEDRDPVAPLEPAREQRVRGAMAALGDLAIAELAGPVDEAGAVRIIPVPTLEVVDQPHAAPPGLLFSCPFSPQRATPRSTRN